MSVWFVCFVLFVLIGSLSFETSKIEDVSVNWGVKDDTLFVTEEGIHIVEKGDGFNTVILSEQEVEKVRLAAESYVPIAPGANSVAFGVAVMDLEEYETKKREKLSEVVRE